MVGYISYQIGAGRLPVGIGPLQVGLSDGRAGRLVEQGEAGEGGSWVRERYLGGVAGVVLQGVEVDQS